MPEPGIQYDYEGRGVLQNLRLIATRRAVSIYILGPSAFWLLFWYIILNRRGEGWFSPTNQLILLLCTIVPAIVGFMVSERDQIKARLRREGYIQRRERGREIDYWLNVAVCGGFFFWLQQRDVEVKADIGQAGQSQDFELGWFYALIALLSTLMTLMLDFFLLGSILWFTVRRIPNNGRR